MRVFLLLIIVVFSTLSLCAQEPLRSDSIVSPFDSLAQVPADSLIAADSTRADSLAAAADTAGSGGIDSVVTYTARDSVIYSISTRFMSMYSRGDVKYKTMRLTADRIDVNWTNSVMHAYPYPDSLKDSAGQVAVPGADTAKSKNPGAPVMKDGGEEYHGTELSYNFRTKKGRITVGETVMDQGYYHGEDIKKVDSKVMFVQDGRYTTCDLPDPHYYFFSPRMKVMMQDKVVAEPVYLYIAGVPIFPLPFAVFPNQGGRRSGIIAPAYGEDNNSGRYLRHLGYYFALSEYLDLTTTTDLYTRGGWTGNAAVRYNLLYNFSGSVSGQYRKVITGEDNDPDRTRESAYQVQVTHRQEIDPTSRFDVNFTFASNNNYQNTLSLQQALNQSITSNATISKQWEGTPNSISLSVSRRQDLRNNGLDQTLPSIQFNHSQSYPFRRDQSYGDEGTDLNWYENIGFTYNANANNRLTRTNRLFQMRKSAGDTLNAEAFEKNQQRTLNQNVSLLITPKLGYFTVSPHFNYSDSRAITDNEKPGLNSDTTNVQFTNTQVWSRAGTISTGISADTRLYGILQPNMLGIEAFRHTLQPSFSFTYNKQIIGENLPERQMLLGFSLGNVFEMKTKAEEGKEPDRITLLNLSTGVSYNFAADSLRLSNVPVNFRTNIGNLLSIDGGLNYDLYRLVLVPGVGYRRLNQFEAGHGRLARLTSVRFGFSTQLSGERKSRGASPPTGGSSGDTTTVHNVRSGFVGLYEDEEPDFSIPWNLSLSMDYAETKDPPNPSRSINMRGDLGFSLTENWKITASGSYDVLNKEFAAPMINISRDLHCWLLNFSWVPTGSYRHYQFEIRVKAPQLQDIKLTKSGADYDLR